MFTNAQNVARVTSTRALTHTHVFRSRRKTRCLEVNTTLFNKNDYNSASRLPQGEFRENLNLRLGNRQHWVHPEREPLTKSSVSSCIWLAYIFRSNGIR